jgi:hypothetical protein
MKTCHETKKINKRLKRERLLQKTRNLRRGKTQKKIKKKYKGETK